MKNFKEFVNENQKLPDFENWNKAKSEYDKSKSGIRLNNELKNNKMFSEKYKEAEIEKRADLLEIAKKYLGDYVDSKYSDGFNRKAWFQKKNNIKQKTWNDNPKLEIRKI